VESWIVFATVVAAFAGLVAACAAVWLALQNRQLVRDSGAQVKASQDQVRASQEQVREANAARYNAQLPILVPGVAFVGITPPYLPSDAPREVEVQAPQYSDMMNIRNIGPVLRSTSGVARLPCSVHRPTTQWVACFLFQKC